MPEDRWSDGDAYERYLGRWSRRVAVRFLDWLAVDPGKDWLDVGCGTGALTATIVRAGQPRTVVAVEPAPAFLATARDQVRDERVTFLAGGAEDLPVGTASVDVACSGLVLNFIPHIDRGLTEMSRAVRPGGRVAGYIWDYAGGMEIVGHFWDAAVALDPTVAEREEVRVFPRWNRDMLERTLTAAGLADVRSGALDVAAVFPTFDDYWQPFLGGVGTAGTYLASLGPERVAALRDELRGRVGPGTPITLNARALACSGRTG